MSSWVFTILSLSISGSLLALAIFACRPLFKSRLSKAFGYYIWALVLLRLLIPAAIPLNAMNALFGAAMQTAQAPASGAE